MKRVFLVGCPRSGTTLVQSLIGAHPSVFTLPETAFFMYLWGDYPSRFYGLPLGEFEKLKRGVKRLSNRLGWGNRTPSITFERIYEHLGRDCPADLKKRLPWRLRSAAEAYVETLDSFSRENDCSCWLEKTPGHFAYINDIRTHVPGAQFIHLLRNPVDTIQSLQSAAAKYPKSPAWEHFADLDLCLDVWIRSARTAIANANRGDTLVVSFDHVLQNAASFVAKLFTFIALEEIAYEAIEANQPNIANSIFDETEPWKNKTKNKISQNLAKGSFLSKSSIQYISEKAGETWRNSQEVMRL